LAKRARAGLSDKRLEQSLTGPLKAAAVVLTEGNPTQLEFATSVLESFMSQLETLPDWQLEAGVKSQLLEMSNRIRSRLAAPAPQEVVLTRHNR
jgi:hypothetical protein